MASAICGSSSRARIISRARGDAGVRDGAIFAAQDIQDAHFERAAHPGVEMHLGGFGFGDLRLGELDGIVRQREIGFVAPASFACFHASTIPYLISSAPQ